MKRSRPTLAVFFVVLAGLVAVFHGRAGLVRAGEGTPTCPPGGTTDSWENYAADFFERHCNQCHNWNNYTYVYSTRFPIFDLVTTGAMPPIEHLSEAEIARFEAWIGCDLPFTGPDCPPRGTYLSYDSFGAFFFDANCTRCHSKSLPEGERSGAPLGFDWDDYESIRLHAIEIRDALLKAKMPPDFAFVPPEDISRLVEWVACGVPEHANGTLYQRADANDDGELNIADAIAVLSFLFQGGNDIHCLDASDADGNGLLEITDGIYLLRYLFLGGEAPPNPYGVCGGLPALGCERFAGC